MIETPEQIQSILNVIGETITFPTFSINAVPSIEIQLLSHGEASAYLTEVQLISFYTSTANSKKVNKGDTFMYSEGIQRYLFTVDRPPVADLTGWSTIYSNLTSKIPL